MTSSTEEKLRQYLKRVTTDLGQTRKRLREVEERYQEPVAVVSMACRFPGGVGSPEALWDLVASGGDGIGEFPEDRGWDVANLYHPDPDHLGGSYVREGGFLYDADRFDAGFFGISPREALAMEPQQRLLLETSWELLERAGIDPGSLKGSATGVYAGAGLPGFGTPHIERSAEGYLVTGNALSVLSGRVAFTLGLEGPAVSVDTACSSSLVALHLACQALRQGECSLALAGGITVMATPAMFTEFSRQRGLATDGRCKPFAEAADGTAFSEGAGLLLLERLSDARRLGHQVLAVVRGSAVNQDGASNGLTAPNGPSQERVIRQALVNAGLSAAEVDVVEAHGTGTRLGDPIEAGALLATYGRDRPEDRPLWLGSLKSNIGHAQGAAGVAGVIKMIMAMRHGTLPATLHVDEPTSHVDWSGGAVRLLTEPVEWRGEDRPRRAGVSAFGMSGTNAHLIVEQAPEEPEPAAPEPGRPGGVVPWVVSARGPEALRAQARALAGAVAAGDLPPVDVGWSLATTRASFEHRAVVVGHEPGELLAGLEALAAGEEHPGVVSPGREIVASGAGPVLVFPGQGSQWAGMGAALLESSPAFAARIAECERALAPYVDWSLTGVLRGDGAELDRVDVVQPVLWAMMVSLAAVWAAHGVVPAAVIGHSQGEIAAACVAGVLSLDDGAKVVALRSKALRRLAGGGAMASLGVGRDRAEELLTGGVGVAAVNGPSSTVVSGPPDDVKAVVARAEAGGLRARLIDVDYASHGPQVDQITDELHDILAGIEPSAGQVAFYSTVTATRADATGLGTPYWVTNLREPVRFADTVQALLRDGHRVFIEASPHPVLTLGMEETFEDAGTDAVALPTLRRDRGDRTQLAHAFAQAFTTGTRVDWTGHFPAARRVDLPTYAFQRQRYWVDPRGGSGGDPAGLGLVAAGHPLLGAAIEQADGDTYLLTGRLPASGGSGWLADHRVLGTVLLPGAALVEWALRAADEVGCGAVEELVLQAPLVLPDSGSVRVQIVIEAAGDDGRRAVRMYSRSDQDGDGWVCHAAGVLGPEAAGPAEGLGGAWPPPGARPIDVEGFYERVAEAGYGYGPAFQGVRAAWRDGADVLAEVVLPEDAGGADGFGVHPALLDAALHPGLLAGEPDSGGPVWLPFAWNGVALWAGEATATRVRISPRPEGERGERGLRLVMADAVGAPVLGVESVVMRPADTDRLRAAGDHGTQGLFTLDWTPLPAAEPGSGTDGWAVLGSVDLGPDVAAYADLDALLAGLGTGASVPPVVVTAVPPSGDALGAVEGALELLQGWLAEPRLADARLVVLTRGAVASDDPDLAGAAVWGLVRSAQSEDPDRFVLVDLDDGEAAGAIRRAVEADEPQVAVRAGRLLTPRLARTGADGDERPELDPEGTVLITGGTGTVGALVAEHLVRTWRVRRLLLVSRRGSDAPGAPDLQARLTELGAEVRVVAADVADAGVVDELVAGVDAAHPLTGVVHAAGVLDDAVIMSQSPERLRRVWAAKAEAAANLYAATAGLRLGMFVVFSSAASCLGSPGQGNYAAANAFCDALAVRRRAAGLPATSIGWGLWADASGMTGHMSETDLARVSRAGSRPLTSDHALELLDAACRHGDPYLLAVDLDRQALATRPVGALPAPLRAFGAGRARRTAAGAQESSALAARLAGLDAAGRSAVVLDLVCGCVAGVLGYASAAGVRSAASFKDLGFDSLTAVELRNRLSAVCGLRLPATLVFDYPTPEVLAGYLGTRLTGETVSGGPVVAVGVSDEPVAIVAMACRFPGGVSSADELWDLVAGGGDAMGEFPGDRGWDLDRLFHPDPDHPGTSYAREGGFVHEAGDFDAGFFGVNPREALATDPQQRLLLETSWELLERAGIDPHELKGSATGVYAGVMYHDYGLGRVSGDPQLEAYALLAGSGSVVCGRVAYTLGLEGPAMTVDTACSSSLVAMHLAAQALRQGECSLALAGGVTVMATPDVFTGFSRQRGLAPDGRCKPFAAAADGTGWGEGVGLVLLERLSDARRNGHEVLAVIRGSAVNQDGASNGLTAPNGPSQERVIRQALANAGLSAAEVDAVEAHGTGTTLGDPIEAQALLATYGREHPEETPLWLGSVKSNIGHTQAAAGVAGVIKMVMAMRHETLPVSLHVDEPSPHVDWDTGAVRLLTEPVAWPRGERPRRAGVSSFGASGTNAHVIIEQAPEPAAEPAPAVDAGGVVPWVLSARGDEALRAQAAALAEHLTGSDGSGASAAEVGWSLLTTRARLDRRAVVVGEDRDQLLAGVRALAGGDMRPGVAGPATAPAGGTTFLFSGQGSQRPGMGAGLYERFPVFAAAFDEVCDLLDPHLEHALRDVVFTGLPGHPDLLDHTTYAQAGLFAVHVALARLLASFGVEPDVVIGHSIGEVAAAHLAGVFDLADACRLVAARATLMGRLPEGGAMAAIQARADELADDVDAYSGRVSIAAMNTPDSTVISGPAELVAELRDAWAGRGRKTKALAVSHAFHSPLMDPILEEFTDAIADLTYREPVIPLISNLTGLPADGEIATPGYWARHIRLPVRFEPSITHVAGRTGLFLELGPEPVLATAAQHTLDAAPDDAAAAPLVLSALTGKQPEVHALSHALARLHTAGTPVDWTPWFPAGPAPRVVALPTYAFQRERFWLTPAGGVGDVSAAGLRRVEHALLPAAVSTADGGLLLTGRLSASGRTGWLADHRVLGTVLVPGSVLVEWALRAADEAGCGGVDELVLRAPLVLPASGDVRVQVVVGPADDGGRREIRVHSRPGPDDGPLADAPWVCHAMGTLVPEAGDAGEGLGGAWPPPEARPIDVSTFYERVAAAGYEYGPVFRGLRAAWRDGADVLAEVALPEAAGDAGGFGIHPALLDAVLHAGLPTDGPAGDDRVWLPFAWNGVTLWAAEATTVRVRLSPREEGEQEERGVRVTVADTTGAPVLCVDSLVTRPADLDQLRSLAEGDADGLFALDWVALPAGTSAEPGEDAYAVLGPDGFGLTATSHPDLAALVSALGAGAPAPSLVLAGVGATGTGPADGLAAAEAALALVQGWPAEPVLAGARLVLVTRGAVAADGTDDVDPASAGVWGLVRSAQAEDPGRFVLLDTDAGLADVMDAVTRAVDAGEWQLAVRSDQVLVPRLVRAGERRGVAAPDGARAWRLAVNEPGTVDNVVPVACPEVLEPLAPGQVRIDVRAAGINFRDVLVGLGMAPGQTGLGGEGAGVVSEVGPGVTGLAVGDRVMGLFEGAFGPVTVADARMVAPVPDGWGWREAAAVPVVFLTAWYGLVELAGLRDGESVLLHAATGGVGMAAVQIARHLGAEVYATASPGKHAVLEEMGIDAAHRASSRDLDFEGVLREATGGRGVDVVLNSLAGPFTDASLRLLAGGGRFMEMGKTDIREPGKVTAEYPDVRYQVFDLVTDAGPERIGRMLAELNELFAAGVLRPAPVRAWPLARARQALRYLSQARHIGKLVLDVPAEPDPDGTVLITGGTGTLGGLVAEHLVGTRGVRRLLLAGRRGADAPGVPELVARLTGLGGDVKVVAADVGDAEAVAALVAGIDPEHPLTGVVHAAGVLDDAVIASQSPERLARVWAAKATAAYNLHAATADLGLGMFVTFSSTAAMLGSPGQANYAAANAYCDALAARRQAEGLPGVSIGWGLWAETSGMTGGLSETDLARMARSGVGALSRERALGLLDEAGAHGDPYLLAADLDLRLLAAQPAGDLPAPLRALGGGGARARRTAAAMGARPDDWAGRLAGLSAGERRRVLLDLVRGHVAAVLGHADPDAVPADAPFKDLGFDSLTAVELRNRLSAATGLRLPPALIFDYPQAGVLADHLGRQISPDDEAAAGGTDIEPVLDDLARLESTLNAVALEDGDSSAVTARLEALLAQWKAARAPENDGTAAERLEAASADQVLDFIDNELGVS